MDTLYYIVVFSETHFCSENNLLVLANSAKLNKKDCKIF